MTNIYDITLTPQQKEAMKMVEAFIADRDSQVFILKSVMQRINVVLPVPAYPFRIKT